MKKKCEFGDTIPPNIYNGPTLRKVKQENRDNKLGIEINNPILSLIELKHTIPFGGSIHNISADPLMVHYWSPYQMIVYKETSKMTNHGVRLCIDATGGLVKKIKRTTQNIKSAHIFLYSIVLHDGSIQVPVCQMLSEIQDIPSITYWLSEWVRAGAPHPNEVVVDYSNALIGAVTRTFTGLTKNEYCIKSFNILKNNLKDTRLSVYVRLDIAHFIKMICRWKCFKANGNKKVKELYVRSIVLLTKAQNLDQFIEILKKIIVVCNSEFDGNIKNTHIETKAETFRKNLFNMIENDFDSKRQFYECNEVIEVNINLEEKNSDIAYDFVTDSSKLNNCLKEIENNAKDQITEGDR